VRHFPRARQDLFHIRYQRHCLFQSSQTHLATSYYDWDIDGPSFDNIAPQYARIKVCRCDRGERLKCRAVVDLGRGRVLGQEIIP
jgi:hypothetical protein